jgi:hypothetical protein
MTVTVKHPFVSTVPDSTDTSLVRPSNWNADHTIIGLGTAAELNAGVANGVATLDSGGQVPLSQIPPLGDLNYQGAWNASTNTPTLASSTGTKGYYYVVSVAGSTNLNGITDWQIGDWAVFNGSVWQKIDNTDSVTSVNGYTGTVVLTAADVGAVSDVTSTDGTVSINTVGTVKNLSVTTAGSTQNVLCQVRNTTGATLTKGTVVYISGATGQIPTVSKALATSDATSAQTLGMMSADLANNANGYVTVIGIISNIDTSAYTDGAQLYLSSTTAGTYTATKQYAPAHLVYVGVVEYAHPTQGKIFVKVQNGYEMDELHNVSAQTPSNGNTLIWNNSTQLWVAAGITAGTGVSVTNGAGSITVANTGVTSVTGTAPVVSSGGATPAISMAAANGTTNGYLTSTDWTTFNNKGSGSVTSVAATVPSFLSVTGTPITSSGTLAITYSGTALPVANGGTGATTLTGYVKGTGTTAMTASSTIPNTDILGLGTMSTQNASSVAITGGSINGTSLGATTAGSAKVTTLDIASGLTLATLAGTSGQVLTSAGAGAVPTWTTPAGGVTLSNDTSTASNLYPTFASATSGSASTIYTGNSNLLYKPSTGELQAQVHSSINGLTLNNATVNTTYSIPSGYNAVSAGPVTIASGVTVTIPSGSVWAIV